MRRFAIIMAGGNGERLFPLSTRKRPKQFLNLYSQDCMINETIKRAEMIVPVENIFIVINKQQENIAKKYIDRRIDDNHILVEPKSLNTAICIAYAMMYIIKKYGNGIVCVFSSDHYISKSKEFKDTMENAIKVAETEMELVTIGIKPEYPCTQFGYINYEKSDKTSKKVIEFVEKPNLKKAKEYISKGYLWNSGIFIWRSETITEAYKNLLPDLYKKIQKVEKYIDTQNWNKEVKKFYDNIEAISIDVGIMSKADNVKVVPATFDWMDIGNLENLIDLYENKGIKTECINNHVGVDSKNITTFCENSNKLFTTMEVKNLIIIDTDEICFVANKKSLKKTRSLVKKVNEFFEKKFNK